MADEGIQINVTDTGTDQVTAALEGLGLTGEQAAERVASGFVRMSTTASGAASNAALVSAAIARLGQAGGDTEAELGAFKDALDRLTNSELKAAEAATASAGAFTATGAAVEATGAKATVAAGGFGTLGDAMRLAATFLSVGAYVSASDSFTKISNEVKQVTTSTTQYNAVLDALHTTSDATGTSIDANAKLFFNLANAVKGTSIPVSDLTVVVDTIAKSLYAAGTPAAQTNNVIKELGESFSKGEIGGRQFLSILTNAPSVIAALANGLGVTTQSLVQAARAQANVSTSTADATIKLEQQQLTVDQADAHYSQLQQQLTKTGQDYQNLLVAGKFSAQAQTDFINKSTQERASLYLADEQRSIASDKQVAGQSTATASSINLSTQSIVDAFVKANKYATDLAATMQGTIGQAVTTLSNDFVFYIGHLNEATGANEVLRQGILALGRNLETVVPLVAAFIAAFVLEKIISTVTALVTELQILRDTIIAIDFATFINPLTIGIAAAIAAVTAIVSLFGNWSAIFTDLKIVGAGVWAAIVGGVEDAEAVLKPLYDMVSSSLQTAWKNLGATISSIFGKNVDLSTVFSDALFIIYGVIKTIVVIAGVLGAAIVLAINLAIDIVTDLINIVKQVYTVFYNLGSVIGTIMSNAVADINNVIDVIKTLLGLQAKVQPPSPAPVGQQILNNRDGGDYKVNGAGQGTDSQLLQMMVSPGERVIVQTPAQQANDNIPHFRDGGSLSVGIGGGLSGINVAYIPSTDSSVTGYTPVIQQAVQAIAAQVVGPDVSPDNNVPASAGDGGTSATDIVSTLNAAMSIFTTSPHLSYGRSVDALAYIRNDPSAHYGVPDYAATALEKGNSVTIYYPSPTVTSTPIGAHESSDVQSDYDTSRSLEIINANTSGGGPGGFMHPDFALGMQLQQQISKDLAAGAIAWEQDPYNPAIIPNNTKPQINFGGISKARDGGDFMVPGAGAVDSRLLAVSPGEQVSVRTPAQQRANDNSNGAVHHTINVTNNITTPNADSLRRSQPQLDRDTQKRLSNIAARQRR